jgi:hypothetical protein
LTAAVRYGILAQRSERDTAAGAANVCWSENPAGTAREKRGQQIFLSSGSLPVSSAAFLTEPNVITSAEVEAQQAEAQQ